MHMPLSNAPRVDDFLTLNGLRFHYIEWGEKGAPVLVLLHGITGWGRSWDWLATAMADRFRVLALDQRGHAETDWANRYSPSLMAEDLEAFRLALGLSRFSVVGQSMGGINGYMYTASHPEVVERLVIGDFGPDVTRQAASAANARARSAADVFESRQEAISTYLARVPRHPVATAERRAEELLVPREDGRLVWRFDALGLSTFDGNAPSEAEQWAALARITCPTLIVHGAESDVLSQQTADRMVATIADCRLVDVPNAGHGVNYERPDAFLAAVRPFLLGESD